MKYNHGYTGWMAKASAEPGQWVLLCYRLPREPSTPRITVWRNLKRLGVGQLSDGLVTLPADARTREQLDWVAEQVIEFGGEASIWLARPATVAQERQVAAAMAAARAQEYEAVIAEATQPTDLDERARQRMAARLNSELRRIERRDFFPPVQRDQAQTAVNALTEEAGRPTNVRKARR
jgi:DNA-binding transcriptional regulator PaaX